jgi:putative membrane protein insertion efficiency factor
MKRVLLILIEAYRTLVSPMLHTLVPVRSGCRFTPSCSDYCSEALRAHGVMHGLRLSARRIARCHPFTNGYDVQR